jgi:hypothetical protein
MAASLADAGREGGREMKGLELENQSRLSYLRVHTCPPWKAWKVMTVVPLCFDSSTAISLPAAAVELCYPADRCLLLVDRPSTTIFLSEGLSPRGVMTTVGQVAEVCLEISNDRQTRVTTATLTMRTTLLILAVYLVAQDVVALWPQPTSLTNGTITMSLSPHFNIRIPDGSPEDLGMAVERVISSLRSTTHEFLSVDRGAELLVGKEDWDTVHTLDVDYAHSEPWSSIFEEATKKLEDRDESYKLDVPLNGTATLRANTSLGLLRGLTTFQQLFYSLPSAYKRPRADESAQTVLNDMLDYQGHLILPFAPFQISDRPMFSWRSVMLDTSRNWFHPTEIEKVGQTLCHMTDGQASRHYEFRQGK